MQMRQSFLYVESRSTSFGYVIRGLVPAILGPVHLTSTTHYPHVIPHGDGFLFAWRTKLVKRPYV